MRVWGRSPVKPKQRERTWKQKVKQAEEWGGRGRGGGWRGLRACLVGSVASSHLVAPKCQSPVEETDHISFLAPKVTQLLRLLARTRSQSSSHVLNHQVLPVTCPLQPASPYTVFLNGFWRLFLGLSQIMVTMLPKKISRDYSEFPKKNKL
jgi:hypothetical protein